MIGAFRQRVKRTLENYKEVIMLKVLKMYPDAMLPSKAYPEDAGYDLYAHIPLGKLTILPGQSILIGTGIKVSVKAGCAMHITNRSGLASKHKLFVGACIVDPGYSNEVFVNLHNMGNMDYVVSHGDRIAQAMVYHLSPGMVELNADDYETEMQSFSRNKNGFGSSGK
jgi:dUTP pyrophosphatase